MRRFDAPRRIAGCAVLGLLFGTASVHGQMTTRTGGTSGGGISGGAGGLGGGSSAGGLGGTGLGGTGTGTGSTFLPGTSNFLGNTGTTGATGMGANRNFGGGTGGTGSATGQGSAFQGISSSNILGSYFANPQSAGMPTGTTKTRFGAPLYNIATTTISGGGSTSGFNRGGTASLSSSTYQGSSSIGVRRAPAYSTTLGFNFQPLAVNSVQTSAQQALVNSSRLPSKANMQVAMDGETLVLQGSASSERERQLAEALLRLTPGVHDLRNELVVQGSAP